MTRDDWDSRPFDDCVRQRVEVTAAYVAQATALLKRVEDGDWSFDTMEELLDQLVRALGSAKSIAIDLWAG